MAADPTKALINIPLVDVDKIFFARQLTISIPNSTTVGARTAYPLGDIVTSNHGLIVVGKYSYDGGSTYQQFTSAARTISDLSVQVSAYYDYGTDSIQFNYAVNATVGSDTTIPIIVRVALIQGDTGLTKVGTMPDYEQKTVFDSRYTRPKLYRIVTYAGTGSISPESVAHGFTSGTPDVLLYTVDSSSNTSVTPNIYATSPGEKITIDATNVTFGFGTTLGATYYINVYYPAEDV